MTDQFGNLGDYGVSEGVEPVTSQPDGNPIMPSTHEGHGVPLNRCDKCSCFPKRQRRWMHGEVKSPRSRLSEACGVGNNPDTVASVRGTNGARWYALPLRIIPDRGQRSEYISEPSIQQLWAVLHDDELRSKLANEPLELAPQSASFTVEPKAGSARRNVLAGETSADNVNGNSIGSKLSCRKLANVIVAGDVCPEASEISATLGGLLTEGDGLETARAFEAKGKPSYAAEKVEDAQLAHPALANGVKPAGLGV